MTSSMRPWITMFVVGNHTLEGLRRASVAVFATARRGKRDVGRGSVE